MHQIIHQSKCTLIKHHLTSPLPKPMARYIHHTYTRVWPKYSTFKVTLTIILPGASITISHSPSYGYLELLNHHLHALCSQDTFLYSAYTYMAKSQVTIKITIINHESMSHTSNYERLSLSQMDIHTSKLSSYLLVTGVNRYSNHP